MDEVGFPGGELTVFPYPRPRAHPVPPQKLRDPPGFTKNISAIGAKIGKYFFAKIVDDSPLRLLDFILFGSHKQARTS